MTLLIEWNTQIQKQKLSMTVMNPNPKGELVTNTAMWQFRAQQTFMPLLNQLSFILYLLSLSL